MKYFKLFSNCLVFEGFSRSIICDIQRGESELISKDLEKIIKLSEEKKSINDILMQYSEVNRQIIQDYFSYLVDKEYGFICDSQEFENFPKLNIQYRNYFDITNCVIEIPKQLKFYNSILLKLKSINLQSICLIGYDEIDESYLEEIISMTNSTEIELMEVYVRNSSYLNYEYLKKLNKFAKLTKLVLHHSELDKIIEWKEDLLYDLIYIKNKIKNFNSCGIVHISNFNSNIEKVVESLNRNSCLNKKLSIDSSGSIKNCLSINENFGNIIDKNIDEIILTENFKKYWNLTKDDIQICKDCEFRHICTDCRAFTESNSFINNIDTSKPLKCGYNPYDNTWEDWSANPLKLKIFNHKILKQ